MKTQNGNQNPKMHTTKSKINCAQSQKKRPKPQTSKPKYNQTNEMKTNLRKLRINFRNKEEPQCHRQIVSCQIES